LKSCIFFSLTLHGAFLVFAVVMGTLLSKPRMSYYAVDLFSSLPSGSSAAGNTINTPAAEAKPAEEPVPMPEERAAPKEAIRIADKAHKKSLVATKPAPAKPKPHSAAFEAAMKAAQGEAPTLGGHASTTGAQGSGSGMGGASGAGVVGEAGPAFPFPWYLKAIADKLDKQWHPPQEFQSDTVCTVAFTIHRDGQVSGQFVEKNSGDTFFDQLAVRAVLYANPLPPLPAGFPDETLKVHMKFVGKHL
jgi:TonB family protein